MSIATDDPGIPCGADFSASALASLLASTAISAAALSPHQDSKYTGYSSPSTSTLTSTPASTPVSSISVTPTVSRSTSRSASPVPSRASELAAHPEHASRSASSSSNSSSNSNSSTVLARLRFPHFRAPSVESSPVLVQMCEHCIEADDAPDLAAIARARGLPTQLRARAWPFLLRTHPHVLKPRLLPASEGAVDISTEVPHKRIHNDLSRLLLRVARTRRGRPGSAASSTPPSALVSSSGSPVSVASPGAGDAVGFGTDQQQHSNSMLRPAVVESLERAVAAFITKYGHQAPYERGMVWVAYTLSQAMGGIPLESEVFEDAMLVFLHDDDTDNVVDDYDKGGNVCWNRSAAPSHTAALYSSGLGVDEQETEVQGDRPPASASGCMARTVAYFLSQIRAQLPALGHHFDQECMLGFLADEEWLVWWLKWFGARALCVDDAARLWDAYFGFREVCDSHGALTPREWHVFNSLSVLSAIQFRLLELDQSEMRQMLLQLPVLDVELVAGRAEDLAERARERQQELNIKHSVR